MQANTQNLFDPPFICPDPDLKERLDNLVGLDNHKIRLTKTLALLVNAKGLTDWAKKFHPNAKKVVNTIVRRPSLVVLEGDVGSGKTELATTIGDAVARQENISITVLPLSLSTRGQGRVGEMTQLISSAFDEAIQQAKKFKRNSGKPTGAVILLVDEADALTQSRENSQMHHEDKAGVNAFIRGVDIMANGKLPAAVIMCTNRVSTLDPAVKRRAAEILTFHRPTKEQRYAVLKNPLVELNFKEKEIQKLVDITGKQNGRDYGFTFSDLMQRLLPSIVLDAYPDNSVTVEGAINVAKNMKPTPPFKNEG